MLRTALKAGVLQRAGPVLVATACLALYVPTARALVHHWTANDVYSYAFMVPVISAAMIWMRRQDLAAVSASPALVSGALLTAGGLLMLLAGRASSTNLLEELSLVLTIAGLTLLLFGPATLRIAAFPIAYLLAMIPMWDYFTTRVHPFFQLYSAVVGVGALRLAGIPVMRDGFIIELPYRRLEVAEACSGVNYLIAVLCVGAAATYLFVEGRTRRLFIVGAAASVALLSNAARVATVAAFAYHDIRGENGDIHGPYALLRSLLISGIGYAVLFGLIARFGGRHEAHPVPVPCTAAAIGSTRSARRTHRLKALAVTVALVMLGSSAGLIAYTETAAVRPSINLSIPSRIAGWEAAGAGVLPRGLEVLPFDDKLTRRYRSDDGTELHLMIGQFYRQSQGRELAGYDVRAALGTGERSSYAPAGGNGIRVIEVLSRRKSDTSYVAYWFTVSGEPVDGEVKVKLLTAWNAIVRGRSDGVLAVVRTRARPSESREEIRQRIAPFIERLISPPLSSPR